MDEALGGMDQDPGGVFPTTSGVKQTQVTDQLYQADKIYVCSHKLAQPNVFIPVFPGTNCEYDSTKAFERAGAKVVTRVFKNLTAEDIRDSVEGIQRGDCEGPDRHVPGRLLRR